MEKPRILSVDDESSFTEMIKSYFEPRGYPIDVATAGDKALKLLKNNEYDIALLDLKMEGLNGDDVMREAKKTNDNMKFIFITAYTDSGKTRERLLGEGAYAFMDKPITSLKDLEDLINEAVNS